MLACVIKSSFSVVTYFLWDIVFNADITFGDVVNILRSDFCCSLGCSLLNIFTVTCLINMLRSTVWVICSFVHRCVVGFVLFDNTDWLKIGWEMLLWWSCTEMLKQNNFGIVQWNSQISHPLPLSRYISEQECHKCTCHYIPKVFIIFKSLQRNVAVPLCQCKNMSCITQLHSRSKAH